jgi:hypothetical protein
MQWRWFANDAEGKSVISLAVDAILRDHYRRNFEAARRNHEIGL